MASTPPYNGSDGQYGPDGQAEPRASGRAQVPGAGGPVSPADPPVIPPRVSGSARVGGSAPVSGSARVGGSAPVSGSGRVGGSARVPVGAGVSAGAAGGRTSGAARVGADRPVSPGRSGGSGGTYSGKKKIRPRWGRIAAVALAAILAIVLIVVAVVYFWLKSKDDRLAKIDPFSQITGGRPPKAVEGALNILMLGSDSRDPEGLKGDGGAARTDSIVLMHIPSSHDKAFLISVPRDYYVYVPKSADGKHGDTKAKINAAYAWGGATLMVQTLEQYTGVRIDHVMVIDFAGFAKVTDALGGVDMYVEKSITSIHGPTYRKFHKGNKHFTGEEALDYIRQRYQFPRGDFDRIRHQQEFLKALMNKAVSSETLTSPSKLNNFLNAITDAITVDEGFSLVDMALNFRNLRGENLSFTTAPNDGTDKIKGESVVVPNEGKAKELFQAIAQDKAAEHLSKSTPKPTP